jgi:DNA-binding NarL/FixJ family response regulator
MRATVEGGELVIRIPIRCMFENVTGAAHEAIVDTLTVREREVLDQLLTGKPHKQAAEALGISRRAVSYHTNRIYRKLQIHSRQELLLKFRKDGG